MEISLHSFLVSIPIAVVLWALMLLAVAVAVVLMATPRGSLSTQPRGPLSTPPRGPLSTEPRGSAAPAAGRSRPGRSAVTSAPDRPTATGSTSDGSTADDLRFADEVTVAAERAAATAVRCRADWAVAERELDAAWEAYQEADAAARRTWAATSYPLMSRRRKLGDNADRERYLHHAATVAWRQRELSIAQLNDVFAHRGWNPRLHPVVQESLLRNAIRENRFAAYQAAQRRERAAWQQAEIAAEAVRALRAEAAAALGRTVAEQPVVNEFWWAEPWTTSELPVAA